jgi:hypothetical protein
VNTQPNKINPEDYSPDEKPIVMKMMERAKVKEDFGAIISIDGSKKIISGVPEAPYPVVNGDESCPFASCFTSVYMYLEKFEGTERGPCTWGRYGTDGPVIFCNLCGECGRTAEFDFKQYSHNSLQWFFMMVMGGRQNKVNPDALFGFAGYRYEVLTKNDGYETLKNAIVRSVSNDVPILMTFEDNAGLCNLITGYDNKGDTVIGYDGNFTYWRSIIKKELVPKDGYLDNHMFYLSDWFNQVDKVYIITGKNTPTFSLRDALDQLAHNIHQDNENFINAARHLIINSVEGMSDDEIRNIFETGADLFREQMDTRHKLTLALQTIVRPMTPEKYHEDVVLIYQSLAMAGGPGYRYMDMFEINMWDVFGGIFKDYIRFMENPFVRNELAECLLNAYRNNRNAAIAIENLLLKWQRDDDIAAGKTGLPPLELKAIKGDQNHQEISLKDLNRKIKVKHTDTIDLADGLDVIGELSHTLTNGQVTITMDDDRAALATKNKYNIPVKIDICLKADKDICLYFGKGRIILNNGDNERALVIRDIAVEQEREFEGKGAVPKNEFIELSWIIHKNFMALTVNGEIRYFSMWSWPYMFKPLDKLPFRFGTNRRHAVTVKKLTISELD